MIISGKKLANNLFLAPMAGFSDVGFRAVCAYLGADVTFSEMISSQALKFSSKKTLDMTITHPFEKVKIAQIFGHDCTDMANASISPALSGFDAIDINMGCPAPKIYKNGDGAALLNNLGLASKIIQAVVSASNKQVSVKVRLGDKQSNIAEIVRVCQESGASFITVHGRTREQGYSGNVNLEAIALAKSVAKIPVVGNGDVFDIQNYKKMLSTDVDGVMIGRGAVGEPWFFAELLNKPYENKIDLIKKHISILKEHYPEKWLVLYLRKHFLAYASALAVKGEDKKLLATSDSIEKSLEVLSSYNKLF